MCFKFAVLFRYSLLYFSSLSLSLSICLIISIYLSLSVSQSIYQSIYLSRIRSSDDARASVSTPDNFPQEDTVTDEDSLSPRAVVRSSRPTSISFRRTRYHETGLVFPGELFHLASLSPAFDMFPKPDRDYAMYWSSFAFR